MSTLWIRGIVFTLLVPGAVGVYVPWRIYRAASAAPGWRAAGWALVAAASVLYGWCLFGFLHSGGTPAIFFTRHVRFAIGEEPPKLVRTGLYRVSRNPMHVGVLLVVFGQAVIFASIYVAAYAIALWLFFHVVVVYVEEPHLRRERGPVYDEYRRRVPRWLGRPR